MGHNLFFSVFLKFRFLYASCILFAKSGNPTQVYNFTKPYAFLLCTQQILQLSIAAIVSITEKILQCLISLSVTWFLRKTLLCFPLLSQSYHTHNTSDTSYVCFPCIKRFSDRHLHFSSVLVFFQWSKHQIPQVKGMVPQGCSPTLEMLVLSPGCLLPGLLSSWL